MKETKMMTTLAEVISKVLSLMYFLFEDGDEPFEAENDKDYQIFTIDFWNGGKYQIIFKIHKKIMKLMVENFEGVGDSSLQPEDIISGVKEFVNIVCGNFMTEFPNKMGMGLPVLSSLEEVKQNTYNTLVAEKEWWIENSRMFVRIVS
jgi:hypothetical protein